MPVREILLFTIAGGGLLMDLLQERVDNRLICLGFGFGLLLDIFYSGFAGILRFFLRGLLPPVLSPSPVLLSYDRRRRHKASLCSGRYPGLSESSQLTSAYLLYRGNSFSCISYFLRESQGTHFLFHQLFL